MVDGLTPGKDGTRRAEQPGNSGIHIFGHIVAGEDVEAALDYLRKRIDIPIQKIGLIGHSEGGMIAPMVAARRRDVAFVVCLAGPGVPLDKLQMKQNEEIAKSEKQADTVLQKNLKMHAEVFASIKEIERPDVLESKTRSILKEYNF